MKTLPWLALPVACLSLGACDEGAIADAVEDRAETRGINSCTRAVKNQTGNDAAAHNPAIPVVEVNQFVIDIPGEERWTCYTDDAGRAQQLVKTPLI